jgi:mono/diheme cytochrome c family protein
LRTAASFAALAAALACAGGGDTPAPAPRAAAHPALAEIGAEYFQSYCVSCHGRQGRGDGPVAPALQTPPADLTRIAARRGGRFPDGEIARFIDGRFEVAAHGSREMPVWGARFSEVVPEAALSEEIARGKIATLVEYLKSIQEGE